MKSKFDVIQTDKMVKDYKVGTATNNYNGTVFWQIDDKQNIRGGKIINYHNTGKRTKYINWVHAIQLKKNEIQQFKLNQCLFGLHLSNRSNKSIAIVESEKTACIMSMLFKKYEWMATGSLKGLSKIKLEPIKHRAIILYPDLGNNQKEGTPFKQWEKKCNTLNKLGFNIEISDLLERKGCDIDRNNGLDIADYFIENPIKKTKEIKSIQDETLLKLYMKNNKLKSLIDVFDLRDKNDNSYDFQ